MPYALLIAAISFIGFLVGGLVGSGIVALLVGIVLLVLLALGIMARRKKA